MVQHRDAVGGIHGMVEGQHRDPGGEDEALGEREGFGDEQLRHGGIFPCLRDMLANPRLVIAQLVSLDQ
jgi:hypothetical protein